MKPNVVTDLVIESKVNQYVGVLLVLLFATFIHRALEMLDLYHACQGNLPRLWI